MTATALRIVSRPASKPAATSAEPARLHRRHQRVIVRAGTAPPLPVDSERRAHSPTLPGLGADQRIDTLPDWDVEEVVELVPVAPSRVSGVRRAQPTSPPTANDDEVVELAPVSQVRPTRTLRDGMSRPPRLPPLAARAPKRRRPETLLDDVDDERARHYLEEAHRIVQSGFFARCAGQ